MSSVNSSARLNLLRISGFTGFCQSSIADLGALPSRQTPPATFDKSAEISMLRLQLLFFHDATERPIQRHVEAQKAHYSGKKKQYSEK